MVFGGVQGFKGPYDRERDSGNFGFNEGFNIGAKVPYAALGYQYGYRAHRRPAQRRQGHRHRKPVHCNQFVTAGLFHRQKEGLQFGVVWDALIDERDHAERTSTRFAASSASSAAAATNSASTPPSASTRKLRGPAIGTDLIFQASDQYVLFYRLHGCNGGEGRIYAGANNDSDGIVGSDMLLPIGGSLQRVKAASRT